MFSLKDPSLHSTGRKGCGSFNHKVKSDLITESCCYVQLCNLMDFSTPGFPVHHYLLEVAQTHVHWAGDHPAISSSATPSPPAFNLSQHQGLFQWVSFSGGHSIGVSASASVLPMNIQDWSPLGWTGWVSLLSRGLSGVFSSTSVLQKC